MLNAKEYNFWFLTGSQDLYGEETLIEVEKNSIKIVDTLNASQKLPYKIIFKSVVINSDSIRKVLESASVDEMCAGVITWMHTFSPAKMWIAGLKALKKPLLHLHTQYFKEIPLNDIDMDYMNLHQSAHGDREYGFICARLRLPRKVIQGHFEDEFLQCEVADWMRAAAGIAFSKTLRCERFGDNMRQVAVTEGDKVEAQIKLGWEVNYTPIGKLSDAVNSVTDSEVEKLFDEINRLYTITTNDIDAVKYQIKLEIAMRNILDSGGAAAFSTNFEDLYGLEQLPGLACQRLMEQGIGFAGEGDWKTASLLAVMKYMERGLSGGTAFMEDYTYHIKGDGMVLGAHMLEVDPSIAKGEITIDVEPLSIGGKNPPARMKFEGKAGAAICVSLVDMGGRLRMIVNDIEAIEAVGKMPNLPVAQIMWKPLPNLKTSSEAWIYAGGAHHTVMSYSLNAEHMRAFAEMAEIEFIHINSSTEINSFKERLLLSDAVWKGR